MELQAITGTLHIIDGELQEVVAAGLVAQPAPKKAARGRDSDYLFVHLTIEDPPEDVPDALTHDLTEAFVAEYYKTTGSVISALRRSVMHLNALLLRWNVNSAGHSRDGAITCAVLRHNELYVVQVGHGLALIGRNFGVERIPPNTPDLITPLGRSANLDFRFGHYQIQPADMMLLADPRLNNLSTTLFQPALVETEVEIGLEELTDLIGSGSAKLLLIEFSDEPPIDFPDISELTKRIPSPARLLENMPTVRLPKRESDEPLLNREQVETTARHAAAQGAMGLSKVTGGMADMLRQLQPETPPEQPQEGWAIPAAIAIIIPLIIIAIVMSAFLQYGRVAEFTQLRQDINQAVGLAQQAENDAEARQYYNQALALAAQAELIRPGEETIVAQREIAIAALDRLDNITRLNAQPIYTYPDTSLLTAVELALPYDLNGDIYVLDKAQGRVMRHRTDPIALVMMDEEPTPIIFTGQAIQSHVVGDLVDILWRPRGSSVTRDGIAALDSRGELISFYTNFEDLRSTTFGLASE
ncbi:MAG: hypothetical protein KDE51_17660, partial [Anaerolineales bacterium]|nr:hypothetical protein [Anaerolineales bacterium]